MAERPDAISRQSMPRGRVHAYAPSTNFTNQLRQGPRQRNQFAEEHQLATTKTPLAQLLARIQWEEPLPKARS